jgi:hypothetical protein
MLIDEKSIVKTKDDLYLMQKKSQALNRN